MACPAGRAVPMVSQTARTRLQPVLRLLPLCLICACAPFPQIETGDAGALRDASFPSLVPIDEILDAAPDATPPPTADLDARIAALRARANGLRGPVIDAGTQGRMQRGIAG